MGRMLLKTLGGLVLFVLVLALLSWPALKLLIWQGEKSLAAEGLPSSYEELSPTIPRAENAAPELRAILARFTDYPGGRGPLSDALHNKRKGTITPDADRTLEAWLNENASVVDAAHAVLDRPRFRVLKHVPLDPIYPQTTNLVWIFIIRAQQAASRGDLDGALTNYLAANQVAKYRIDAAVNFLELITGDALFSMTCRAISKSSRTTGWNSRQLATLQEAVSDVDTLSRIPTAFRGDAMELMNYGDNELKPLSESEAGIIQQMKLQVTYDYIKLTFIHEAMDSLEAARRHAETSGEKIPQDDPGLWQRVKNKILFPTYAKAYETIRRAESAYYGTAAKQRLLTLTIAIERHKLAHGNYPNQLADISRDILPSIPTDVFTDRELSYTSTPGSYDLMSTGCLQFRNDPRCGLE